MSCIWNRVYLEPCYLRLWKWKYLASIRDDSAITCDQVIESYDEKIKTIPTNFNKKKASCKIQNLYVLVAFLLITIASFIAISI